MRGFLGVSVAPHAAEHLRRPVRQALSCLGDGETAVERVGQSEDGWVAFAGGTADDLIADEGRFTVRLSRALRTAENDLSTADLAALIADDSGLTAIVPPFAAAHRDGPGAPLVVAGDWLGFRQLYRGRVRPGRARCASDDRLAGRRRDDLRGRPGAPTRDDRHAPPRLAARAALLRAPHARRWRAIARRRGRGDG